MSTPNSWPGTVVGVDIGGTTMTIAEVREDGQLLHPIDMPSPAREHGRAVVAQLQHIIRERWPDAMCVGIGTAGVVDPKDGSIAASSDSFHGWTGFPLRQAVSTTLGVPVVVENDVNAFLLGEQQFGSARGNPNCFGVMLGTGVGGAIMLDNSIVHGQHGAAAEIGHMPFGGEEPCSCGTRGHVESLAGGRSIARRYQRLTAREKHAVDATAAEVARAADSGDTVAQRVFYDAGFAIGQAVLQAATLFDLDTAIIGGSIAKAWQWLVRGIDTALARYPLISGATLTVARSTLGADAVLLGAASAAIRHVTSA